MDKETNKFDTGLHIYSGLARNGEETPCMGEKSPMLLDRLTPNKR